MILPQLFVTEFPFWCASGSQTTAMSSRYRGEAREESKVSIHIETIDTFEIFRARLKSRLKRAVSEFDRLSAEFDIKYPEFLRGDRGIVAYAAMKFIVCQLASHLRKMHQIKRRLRSDWLEVVQSVNLQQ